MSIRKKVGIAIIIMIFVYPLTLFAKTQQMGSIKGIVDQSLMESKNYIQLDVIAESNSIATFNTIDLQLNFDAKKLKLLEIKDKTSFCAIFLKEKIDNQNGNFVMQCGTFGYNAVNNAKIVTIVFEIVQNGLAEINFDNSRILANDGYGTNILSYTETHYIDLK